MEDVGLVAAVGAGVVSFLSPCILPLVPPYLCFLAGMSLDELTSDRRMPATARVFARAVAFVLGFSVVFVVLGASASVIGQQVSEHLTWLSRIAGVVVLLLGLQMLGVLRIAWLMRDVRFRAVAQPTSLPAAFVVGLAFGFGWTPCVGPVLASILLLAGAEASAGRGAALLAAYAAGIGAPFLAAALFTRSFLTGLARTRASASLVEKSMGMLLIATGLLIFTGTMPVIGGWLLEYLPALGRIG